MCGICGELGGPDEGRRERLGAMTAQLAHRGPDDAGFFLDAGIGLGHRRLSVIDPAGGHQPLAAADGTVQVVANGELYNFRSLRRTLEQEGAQFRTHADSEVLVHLYASLRNRSAAESCRGLLEQLNGMFAFALWDAPARRLVLARDRLGQKPLFYGRTAAGALLFASELTALRAVWPEPLTRDPEAVWHYFKYGYIPAPLTIVREIRKLPAAHFLVAEGGSVTVRRYWSLPPVDEELSGSEEELTERFRDVLEDAVQARLVADVPLGAFLSGGLDSSMIVSCMRAHGPARTFAVGFGASSYDERGPARQVAAALGTEHTDEEVNVRMAEILPELPRLFGEPFGDSSAVNLWYLARMARRDVTVALSGDGADELLAGYRRYLGRLLAGHYLRMPRCLRRGVIEPLLGMLPDPGGYYGDSLVRKSRLLMDQARRVAADPYDSGPVAFSEEALLRFLQQDRPGRDRVRERAEAWAACDPVTRMMRTELETYLPEDILTKVDRMSMAHGLEARSPFLDHRVVACACRLPLAMKLGWRSGKQVLRRAARGRLPRAILQRPKHGFMLPLDAWLRGPLQAAAREATDGLDADLFDMAYVDRLWRDHLDCRADHSHRLWLLWVWSLNA